MTVEIFETMKAQADGVGGNIAKSLRWAMTRITNLESALAEAERDAARYRWLRDRPKGYDGRISGFHVHLAVAKPPPKDWSLNSAYGSDLDTAIDAAIARSTNNDDA